MHRSVPLFHGGENSPPGQGGLRDLSIRLISLNVKKLFIE